MQILYVLPDYYESYPKPCYGGWGRVYLVVTPPGRVLPCHGATHITTLRFDNVRDRSLGRIWTESSAFQAYRGDEWKSLPLSRPGPFDRPAGLSVRETRRGRVCFSNLGWTISTIGGAGSPPG